MIRIAPLVALTVALVAPIRVARADEPAEAEKPAGVVKVDVEETLDKRPSRDAYATYLIMKKLREAGYVVWSEKPNRTDEYERKKRAEKEGVTRTADPGDKKPEPDLVLKGKIAIGLADSSKFFGADVAFVYGAHGALAVLDKEGKELGKIEDQDEWSKASEKAAREEQIKRIAAFLAAAVLKSEPVHGRLGPKRRAVVDEYIANVARKREENKPAPAPGGANGGGEKQEGGK